MTNATTTWLDRRVALIALIIGLLTQSASLLIWGAHIEDRVAQQGVAIQELKVGASAAADLGVTVARIDERTKAMADTLAQQRGAPH